MNPVKSNSLTLKYQRFIPLGCEDIGIRTFHFEFLATLGAYHFHFKLYKPRNGHIEAEILSRYFTMSQLKKSK